MRGLKQQKLIPSQSWRSEVRNQGVGWVGWFPVPSGAPRDPPLPASPLASGVTGAPGLVATSLQSLPPPSCGLPPSVPLRQISSLMRTPFLRVRAHADPGWSHLQIRNLVTSARHCFHMKSHAQVPGVRMWTCLFKGGGRGHHSTHLDWPEIKDTRKVNTVKANPFH